VIERAELPRLEALVSVERQRGRWLSVEHDAAQGALACHHLAFLGFGGFRQSSSSSTLPTTIAPRTLTAISVPL
jgi:hypothetical protein